MNLKSEYLKCIFFVCLKSDSEVELEIRIPEVIMLKWIF